MKNHQRGCFQVSTCCLIGDRTQMFHLKGAIHFQDGLVGTLPMKKISIKRDPLPFDQFLLQDILPTWFWTLARMRLQLDCDHLYLKYPKVALILLHYKKWIKIRLIIVSALSFISCTRAVTQTKQWRFQEFCLRGLLKNLYNKN